jgi:hypothetical protein
VGHVRDVVVKWPCYGCCGEEGRVMDVVVKWVMLGMW